MYISLFQVKELLSENEIMSVLIFPSNNSDNKIQCNEKNKLLEGFTDEDILKEGLDNDINNGEIVDTVNELKELLPRQDMNNHAQTGNETVEDEAHDTLEDINNDECVDIDKNDNNSPLKNPGIKIEKSANNKPINNEALFKTSVAVLDSTYKVNFFNGAVTIVFV